MPSLKSASHWLAIVSLIGLILLCLAWELWLAPLRPGGSWLVLKVLPLLIPLFGILRGRRYTYQWSALLIWLYFTEGAVRAWSDSGLSARLALAELVLSLVFLVSAVLYIRASRALQQKT
ncbi:MAG: DUF2069 domain-containing protein [Pseudomonadota bacterium]